MAFLPFGFGGGASESEQASESGVSLENRKLAFEPVFDFAKRLGMTGTNLFESPAPVIPLNAQGFLPQQMEGVQTLFRDAISRASGMGGARGRLSPENTGAIFGSALQNISPLLLQMISENVLKSIFMPEQVRQNRLQLGAQSINPLLALASSGGTGRGAASSFNFNVGAGGSGGGGTTVNVAGGKTE